MPNDAEPARKFGSRTFGESASDSPLMDFDLISSSPNGRATTVADRPAGRSGPEAIITKLETQSETRNRSGFESEERQREERTKFAKIQKIHNFTRSPDDGII